MQQFNGKPLVFLDTNVVVSYLRGEPSSSHLFSNEILGKVRLAINSIVLQELFFLAETRKRPEILDQLQQEASLLPLNIEKAEEYLKHAVNLRNQIAHSNDILILSSAVDCDYLVTYDQALKKTLSSLSTDKPQVVTPEQLISQLESKV
ncbi:MAG: PIN domain-containing protein [Nostoc sp. DedQUE12a]|nr:PIN domain-containing protein [Nostoc sp. DedQUE12a]